MLKLCNGNLIPLFSTFIETSNDDDYGPFQQTIETVAYIYIGTWTIGLKMNNKIHGEYIMEQFRLSRFARCDVRLMSVQHFQSTQVK